VHTQQTPDRNQRQQQQQKQRSMEWDGDKEEETNLHQHLQQRQRAWIVAPPAYRELPRPESQQQLWTRKTVQRSNGLLHNFLLHIILHGRLLPLSMLLLAIRVSLAHRTRKCGAGLFLHTSVVRALSLSLSLARSRGRGLGRAGERGSFHVRWELDGLCGIPGETPMLDPTRPGLFRVLRSPAQRNKAPFVGVICT